MCVNFFVILCSCRVASQASCSISEEYSGSSCRLLSVGNNVWLDHVFVEYNIRPGLGALIYSVKGQHRQSANCKL